MKCLSTLLRTLQSTRYIETAAVANEKLINFKLLSNGKRYSAQLMQNWQNTQHEDIANQLHVYATVEQSAASENRTDFIFTAHFCNNIKKLRAHAQIQCPAIIKSKFLTVANTTVIDEDNQIIFQPIDRTATHITTDYFFNSACGLENFYNIQRARKIWWMRSSANPSRYALEPFNLNSVNSDNTIVKNSQSISIKSTFPFGNVNVEQITLVPLHEAAFKNCSDYLLNVAHSAQQVLPAVIRSEINLEAATCALLLDGFDNARDNTLMLHRKLAPYQCVIGCLHKDKLVGDLQDLCKHLSYVLQSAGLRLLENNIFTNSAEKFKSDIYLADSIGVPYALFVDEQSLNTGLLKLRSRDTTLSETIHISDIPQYLLHIFGS